MENLILSFGFGLVTASILALAGVGVTLQFGVTKHVNFAYGSYLALGAYGAWVANVQLGLNLWLSIAVASLMLGVFAVIVYWLVFEPFRRKGVPVIYLLIVTMGLWLILSNLILVVWGPNTLQFNAGSVSPLHIGPFLFTAIQILIIVVTVAILVAIHLMLTRTNVGKAMRAMADDVDLAAATGIDATRIISVTWLVTGALMGLAGGVLALNLTSFQPTFGDDYVFVVFAAVILGGIGQPYGTMLGALVVGIATEVSAIVVNPAFKNDIAFGILIIVVLIRPQGLIPTRERR